MATVKQAKTTSGEPRRPAPTAAGGIRPPLRREVLLGLAVVAVYIVVTSRGGAGRAAAASANGQTIFDVERRIGLGIEPALSAWLHRQGAAVRAIVGYDYAFGYLAGTFVLITWLYLRRPEDYRWARNSFVLLNLAAIGCFRFYPAAPPRLLPQVGLIEHTWGSPLIAHANQLSAMPSLHVGWSFWASVMLARLSAPRFVQVANGSHVVVTVLAVLATANHFVLDAVGAVVLVVLCVRLAGVVTDAPNVRRSRGERVPAADAFFLHVESPVTPQHVCALVILDGGAGQDVPAALRAAVRANLDRLPRWRQRLSAPSRWRRRRWLDDGEPDWQWHIPRRDLADADQAALHLMIADIAATPLPADRPLWRAVVLTGLAEQRTGVVLIVHHVIADGLGLIAQVLNLIEVDSGSPGAAPWQRRSRTGTAGGGSAPAPPVGLRRALAIAKGIGQLATDGRQVQRLRVRPTAQRRFSTTSLPLPELRDIAHRHQSRVSDVLLSAVAGGLHRVLPDDGYPAELRVAVPLAARAPGESAQGNITSAVILDLPLGDLTERARLSAVASRSSRLHTGTRILASQFVKQWVGELLPPPIYGWFVRAIYGGRYFHGIVSNMPGPNAALTMAGAPIMAAYPLVPLAPAAPIAVGAIGIDGSLHLGVNVDPALPADADKLADAIRTVVAELQEPQQGGP